VVTLLGLRSVEQRSVIMCRESRITDLRLGIALFGAIHVFHMNQWLQLQMVMRL
jgi:hypothetical protein